MKKMSIHFLMLVIVGLFIVGCGAATTVQNINNSGYINNNKVTSNKVKSAIIKGAMSKGWMTKEINNGLLESQIRVRGKHLVVVDIPYNSNGYEITYKRSENLNYDPASNSIHRSYNKWVATLEQNINYQLSLIGIAGNNTQQSNTSSPNVHYSKGGNINTSGETIYINTITAYAKNNRITQNIKTECKINQQLSDFIKKYANESGLKVEFKDKINSKDLYLKVQIDDVISQGSAFIGHRKYTTISGTLIRGKKSYGSFKAARVSGGGAFGGFKGSCAVLGRTVDTLGKDVSSWLYSPINGALLGDTRYIR